MGPSVVRGTARYAMDGRAREPEAMPPSPRNRKVRQSGVGQEPSGVGWDREPGSRSGVNGRVADKKKPESAPT